MKSHRNLSAGFQIGFQTDPLPFQWVSHLRIAGLVEDLWRQGACRFFLHVPVSIFPLLFSSLHLALLILFISSISRSILGVPLMLFPVPVLPCCVQQMVQPASSHGAGGCSSLQVHPATTGKQLFGGLESGCTPCENSLWEAKYPVVQRDLRESSRVTSWSKQRQCSK